MLNLIIAVSLLVSPLRLEVSSYPGVVTKEISVKNGDDYNETIVSIYKQDWSLNREGDIVYHPAGSLANSCSEWITVNPAEFVLPPGEIQTVRVSFEVPEESRGGYWSVIFFEGRPPEQEEWTPLVKLAGRVGITTYLEVAGTSVKEAEIKDMEIDEGDLKMEIENKGNIWVRPRIKYWVEREGEEIYRDSSTAAIILPDSRRKCSLKLENVNIQKGDEVIGRVDYGGDRILEGIKKVE